MEDQMENSPDTELIWAKGFSNVVEVKKGEKRVSIIMGLHAHPRSVEFPTVGMLV